MEGKIIKKGNVQEKVVAGVCKAVGAIETTLGPAGKCVAITTDYGTDISRDGSTVAKSITLQDPEENIGAELVKKAAGNTEDLAGDATSTTSVLIKELCIRGQRAISNGANVNEIKAGMLAAQDIVKKYISEVSIKVEGDLDKIHKVATISANNDPKVGDLVVEGLEKVGINGLIVADMASGLDTVIEVTTGLQLDRGWASPQYVTSPEDGKCTLENPYILVAGEKINSVAQMIGLLNDYQENGNGRPLLIVCDEMDDNVNTMFVLNTLRGAIRACVVKGIDFGDNRKNFMADLATVVGAEYICPENGNNVATASLNSLGSAAKVVVSRDKCVIYEGAGDKEEIAARAKVIKARLDDPTITDYDKHKFSKRLASLTGGIAIIRAGGASEVEKMNRKATIEDSILAAKSAIEEGCVPGGGSVLYRASVQFQKDKKCLKDMTKDEIEGAEIVFKSLPIIMKTVAENSGVNGEVVLKQLEKSNFGIGYNAKTKKISNLLEDGVLDSTKAIRVSLENAISAASMILLIDCTICPLKEDSNK